MSTIESTEDVFPARAGMSRGLPDPAPSSTGVPRASGDEPTGTQGFIQCDECSPRERG